MRPRGAPASLLTRAPNGQGRVQCLEDNLRPLFTPLLILFLNGFGEIVDPIRDRILRCSDPDGFSDDTDPEPVKALVQSITAEHR